MVAIAIGVLFMIQLIIIFSLILLNSKIAKFKDLEVRQDKLVQEMNDALGAYLLEVREENDRLVQQLQTTPVPMPAAEGKKPVQKLPQLEVEGIQEVSSMIPSKSELAILEPRKFMPKTMAANVYNRQKEQTTGVEPSQPAKAVEQQPVLTFEQQVVVDYKAGMTVEEIAKKTQRGKTEIELLIKFRA